MQSHNSAPARGKKTDIDQELAFFDKRPDLLAALSIALFIAGVALADDYGHLTIGLFVIFMSIISLFVAAFTHSRNSRVKS